MTGPYLARCADGIVQGHARSDVIRFDGIPFAAPPLGHLRLRPPSRPAPWAARLLATQPGPGPLQRPGPALGTRPVTEVSEDCLRLNIVTPKLEGPRPVMVWIHGGGFTNGQAADPIHRGERRVRQGDVVLVTLDYRLGALGWLHDLDDAEASNLGLRDQLMALRWVKDNISAFGGDPSRVTLFGESAGAMSILALMGAPDADTLFQAVILQSGAAGGLQSPDSARAVRARFLAALSGRSPCTESAERILDTQSRVGAAVRTETGRSAWRPVLDGELVQHAALDAMARPINRTRPMIIGTNRDEQRLYVNLRERLDLIDAQVRVSRVLTGRSAAPAEAARLLVDAYLREHPTPIVALSAILTDLYYRVPAIAIAQARARAQADTWVYRFDRPSPALRGRLGACHALEIPFVFGTLDAPGMSRFAGDDAGALKLSGAMVMNWARFARDGRPADERWTPWRPEAQTCWIANDAPTVSTEIDRERMALWRLVLPTAGLSATAGDEPVPRGEP